MMRMKELLEPPKYTLVLWLMLFSIKKKRLLLMTKEGTKKIIHLDIKSEGI